MVDGGAYSVKFVEEVVRDRGWCSCGFGLKVGREVVE